jgi:DNA-binding transcriptional regulator YiaG
MLILDTGLRVSLTAGASVLDVSRSTLKRWRRGQKSLPIVA